MVQLELEEATEACLARQAKLRRLQPGELAADLVRSALKLEAELRA